MDLARDVGDKLVLDRDGREIGRVDRVILEFKPDGPHVAAIEVDPAALATRLSRWLGRWVAGLEVAFGVEHGRPLRIPVTDILSTDPHIRVARRFADTPAGAVEQTLRGWLPGGGQTS